MAFCICVLIAGTSENFADKRKWKVPTQVWNWCRKKTTGAAS